MKLQRPLTPEEATNEQATTLYQRGLEDAAYQHVRRRRGCPSRCGATAPSSMAPAAMI